jgi:hypothetical protein
MAGKAEALHGALGGDGVGDWRQAEGFCCITAASVTA